MKYLIHTYPKRLWYVNEFLIPSMIEQGINKEDIHIYNDEKFKGNLKAFIESCKYVKENFDIEKGTWHLQDDVVISSDFAERTKYVTKDDVQCGFVSEMYNKVKKDAVGKQNIKYIWLSFPCIYIPNLYIVEFIDWLEKNKFRNDDMKTRYLANNYDDFFFINYLADRRRDIYTFNIKPNLVDHIDYLIGGTSGVKERDKIVTGFWFEDKEAIAKLKMKLIEKGYLKIEEAN